MKAIRTLQPLAVFALTAGFMWSCGDSVPETNLTNPTGVIPTGDGGIATGAPVLTVSLDKTSAEAGGVDKISVTITAIDASGKPAANQTVTITTTHGEIDTGLTQKGFIEVPFDASGTAFAFLVASEPGDAVVTVTWITASGEKVEQTAAASFTQCTAQCPPIETEGGEGLEGDEGDNEGGEGDNEGQEGGGPGESDKVELVLLVDPATAPVNTPIAVQVAGKVNGDPKAAAGATVTMNTTFGGFRSSRGGSVAIATLSANGNAEFFIESDTPGVGQVTAKLEYKGVTAEQSEKITFTAGEGPVGDAGVGDGGDAGEESNLPPDFPFSSTPCDLRLETIPYAPKGNPKLPADGYSTLRLKIAAYDSVGARAISAAGLTAEAQQGNWVEEKSGAKTVKFSTDANGEAAVTYRAPLDTGKDILRVTYAGCLTRTEKSIDPVTNQEVTQTIEVPVVKEKTVEIIEDTKPKAEIILTASAEVLPADPKEKVTITAQVREQRDENAVKQGVKVRFEIVTSGTIEEVGYFELTKDKTAPLVTKADGKASLNYVAGRNAGTVKIVASAEDIPVKDDSDAGVAGDGGEPVQATLLRKAYDDIEVRLIGIGSLEFVSAEPRELGLRGSGFQEQSTVCFKLTSTQGAPLAGVPISFGLSPAPGGPFVDPTATQSDGEGYACTRLNSGTVPSTVLVEAQINIGQEVRKSRSDIIVMSGGKPSAKYLNFNCAIKNVGGLLVDLQQIPCTVSLADRFSNQIRQQVPVFFKTEAGSIQATVVANGNADPASLAGNPDAGIATVMLRTQNPRPRDVKELIDEPFIAKPPLNINPRDGLVTIIAATTGEEEFEDRNGNGQYDPGEVFVDLGEPFVDANDNNQWDSDEEFIDTNGDSVYNPPNNVYDSNTIIWKATHMLWTGNLVAGGNCTDPAFDQSIACPTGFKIGDGGSQKISYEIKDSNLNPPNSSTSVEYQSTAGVIFGGTKTFVPDILGMDIRTVRTCSADRCVETLEFKNFTNGFKGSFEIKDDTPGVSTQRLAVVNVNARYKPIPPINGAGLPPDSINTEQVLNVSLEGTVDDDTAVGPCSFHLQASKESAVADGRSTIELTATPRNKDGNPQEGISVSFFAERGKIQQTGLQSAVITTNAAGIAKSDYIVDSVDGPVKIYASFLCNSQQIVREVTVTLLPQDVANEPRITLSSSKPSVQATNEDSVIINGFVTQGDGQKPPDGTDVTFRITSGIDPNDANKSIGYFKSPGGGKQDSIKATTTNGEVQVELFGGCKAGRIDIEASATLPPSPKPAKATISVNIIKIGSISLEAISPPFMGVKGSGINENAQVRFKILDTDGNPYPPGLRVTFTIDPDNSFLLNSEDVTDNAGEVVARLQSGIIATTFVVKAKAVQQSVNDNSCTATVTGASNTIAVVGVVPNHRYFTFACENLNTAGTSVLLFENRCFVSVADRFSNKVGVATAIHFRSEAGSISAFATTSQVDTSGSPNFDDLGITTVKLRTTLPVPADIAPLDSESAFYKEPYRPVGYPTVSGSQDYFYANPSDGIVTLIAATTGEEEFFDDNNNNIHDANERWVDLPEPFIDANDNNWWDQNELFLDSNNNGKWDPPNGKWDKDTVIWRATQVLWSGGARAEYLDEAGFDMCEDRYVDTDGAGAGGVKRIGRPIMVGTDGSVNVDQFTAKSAYFRATDKNRYLRVRQTYAHDETFYEIKTVSPTDPHTVTLTEINSTNPANFAQMSDLDWEVVDPTRTDGAGYSRLCPGPKTDITPEIANATVPWAICQGKNLRNEQQELEFTVVDSNLNPMNPSTTISLEANGQVKISGKAVFATTDTRGYSYLPVLYCGQAVFRPQGSTAPRPPANGCEYFAKPGEFISLMRAQPVVASFALQDTNTDPFLNLSRPITIQASIKYNLVQAVEDIISTSGTYSTVKAGRDLNTPGSQNTCPPPSGCVHENPPCKTSTNPPQSCVTTTDKNGVCQ